MNTSLIPSFRESIFTNTTDIAVEFLELGIDSCLENEIIKEIPFVGTLYKLGNIAVSVRERHLIQKTLTFIQEINNGKVSDDDRDRYKKRLESNYKDMEKELGYILVSIDRHLQSIKSKILARFYLAYLDSSIEYNWGDFCVLSEILDEISIYDFDALFYIYKNDKIKIYDNTTNVSLFQINRLEKCGVIYENNMFGNKALYQKSVSLTPQGRIFCELSRIEDFIG